MNDAEEIKSRLLAIVGDKLSPEETQLVKNFDFELFNRLRNEVDKFSCSEISGLLCALLCTLGEDIALGYVQRLFELKTELLVESAYKD